MQYHCKRCKHSWYARSDKKPSCCPKCKSYRYETEARKVYKGGAIKGFFNKREEERHD